MPPLRPDLPSQTNVQKAKRDCLGTGRISGPVPVVPSVSRILAASALPLRSCIRGAHTELLRVSQFLPKNTKENPARSVRSASLAASGGLGVNTGPGSTFNTATPAGPARSPPALLLAEARRLRVRSRSAMHLLGIHRLAVPRPRRPPAGGHDGYDPIIVHVSFAVSSRSDQHDAHRTVLEATIWYIKVGE